MEYDRLEILPFPPLIFVHFCRHIIVSIRFLLQGYDRGPGYYPQPGQTPSVPIGQIPQIVGRTYAFTEGTYGVMNEMSVGIGESTCSAIFTADAVNDGGAALLSGAVLCWFERVTLSQYQN